MELSCLKGFELADISMLECDRETTTLEPGSGDREVVGRPEDIGNVGRLVCCIIEKEVVDRLRDHSGAIADSL